MADVGTDADAVAGLEADANADANFNADAMADAMDAIDDTALTPTPKPTLTPTPTPTYSYKLTPNRVLKVDYLYGAKSDLPLSCNSTRVHLEIWSRA